MATKKPFGWNTVVGALKHKNTVNEKTVQGIAAAQAMLSMNNNNRSTFTITPVPSPNASKSKQSQNTRTILEFHTVLFLISVVLQAISSLFTDYMMDWDETANYHEPLHFMLYGRGVQTFEWNRDFALRSPLYITLCAAIAHVFKWLGFSRYFVFYGLRAFMGFIGSVAIYFLADVLRRRFGEFVSLVTFVLIIFNHNVLFFLNRIGLDSLMAVLNIVVFGLWLNNSVFFLIFLAVFTVMMRITYLPVFGLILLHLLFSWEDRKLPFREWLFQLFFYTLSITMFWIGMFLAIDSYWYRKPTLALYNFIHFHIFKEETTAILSMSSLKYLECFMQDNNAIVFVGALCGLYLVSKSRPYALPFIVNFIYLQMMSHKEERFIYFLYPPLCFFCSVAAFWMLQETFVVSPSQYLQSMNAPEEVLQALRNTAMPQRFITKSSAKRIPRGKTLSSLPPSIPVSQEPINVHTPSKSQQQKIPRRVLILLGILVFYVFSGMSTTLLRVYQYSPHYYFYNHEVEAMVHIDNQPHAGCFTNFPWSSWWLPASCQRLYSTQLFEEPFPGYNKASFRRFENPKESIMLAPSSNVFIEEPIAWNENTTSQLRKYHQTSKKFNVEVFEKDAVFYIFFQGGSMVDPKTSALYKQLTTRQPRHSRQTTTSVLNEVLLSKYLEDFELVVESFGLPAEDELSVQQHCPHPSAVSNWQQFGLWMVTEREQRIALLSAWRRYKKRKSQ